MEAAIARELPLSPAHDFEEVFGKGVRGWVPANEGHDDDTAISVAVGHRTFMEHLGISIPPSLQTERDRRAAAGQICSFIALNDAMAGLTVLEDIPREEIAQLAPDLRKEHIRYVVLLTGDSEVVAQQIGRAAQVDRIVAHCLPEQKVHIVQELQNEGHRVLMVGDGVNDAPALATAAVGMALGTQG